ncbi:hypothetical protein GCM10010343_14430 [Streptomyces avidinii]|nr:hypothetical protein GCM10010343_14430 [Streptomyces avidinii]
MQAVGAQFGRGGGADLVEGRDGARPQPRRYVSGFEGGGGAGSLLRSPLPPAEVMCCAWT